MNGEQIFKTSWREPKFILRLAGMILLAGIIVVAIIRDRIVNQPQWQVNVIGRGTVEYQPDIATVSLGVQVEKVWGADVALAKLNTKVKAVVDAISKLGIPADAIQTQTYSLYPQYTTVNDASVLAGYGATQELNVKISDLQTHTELLNKVISEGTKAGVNQINGIGFDISNIDELKQQARLKAIEDARKNANSTADTAGVRLKKIVGWWENFIEGPGMGGYYADGKGGGGASSVVPAPVVPTGKQEIVVEINLTYLVK